MSKLSPASTPVEVHCAPRYIFFNTKFKPGAQEPARWEHLKSVGVKLFLFSWQKYYEQLNFQRESKTKYLPSLFFLFACMFLEACPFLTTSMFPSLSCSLLLKLDPRLCNPLLHHYICTMQDEMQQNFRDSKSRNFQIKMWIFLDKKKQLKL